ncbi:MAG TPA: hypothetical protein VGP08_25735 [Pyrinomonadaceae bacterium]|jgi:hypothetical protein|nr:hypothetical protein [Pyrinomonadaceae bacterium]
MNREELIEHTKRLMEKARNPNTIGGVYAEVCEFLRVYAGTDSDFYISIKANPYTKLGYDRAAERAYQILKSFLEYVEAGLRHDISPERRAQLDVVSDFLEMANTLLQSKDVHPAAPAVLIGATLEEFLRTWVEAESLSLGNRKPGLETYSQVLRDAGLITKQDGKDITSWAGVRNHAAHGEWNEVSDRSRINLMLEGVNLFMRKYS